MKPQQKTVKVLALGALALSMLMASIGTSITNVALPTLAIVFSAPFSDVQKVVLVYLLVITILIVGGRAVRRYSWPQACFIIWNFRIYDIGCSMRAFAGA